MMLQELKIHRGNKFSYYFQASVVCDKMPFNGEGQSAESFAVLVPAYKHKNAGDFCQAHPR